MSRHLRVLRKTGLIEPANDDSDPNTYAASHIAYSSCPDRSPPCGVPGRHSGIIA
jgi:hypothetical protein